MICKNVISFTLLLNFVATVTGQGQGLRDTTLQADYVIICTSSNQPKAERLAEFRRFHSGFTVRVVSIESVYVDFHFPNAPDSSLRSFIAFASQSWSAPHPRFFVLAGNINTIPSHKEPGLQPPQVSHEDSIFVDTWFLYSEGGSSSTVPSKACIGRLPAWTAGQLDTIISKTIAYEQAAPDLWMRSSLALADYYERDGSVFEYYASSLQRSLSESWPDTTMVHVRATSPQHQDLSGFLSKWRQGAAFVSLVGHGYPWFFSESRYLTASDLLALDNGTRLPICFFLACSQAYYRNDSASIVERLLFQQSGGAVATIASTGAIYVEIASAFFQELVSSLSTNSKLSLGEAMASAQNSALSNYPASIARRLTLLGDPAITPKRLLVAAAIIYNSSLPTELSLAQNYPNPFNSTTRFVFSVPQSSRVVIEVFNVLGECVARILDRDCDRGSYSVEFSASRFSSGVYLARLRSGDRVKSCKIVLLK